ncbi:MAG TPA: phosphatidylinositol-specific phospholipase C/glycerophosphodiester phosphodiesterase family protein [Prolixibacteraceae bacterium]|nr:phosphatidylinositol-specific phospholipase C/glycerophosphodiester phosphodiesterase family protein [Prolixibacteraceae bacterium]
MKRLFSMMLLLLIFSISSQAQYTTLNAHSHNDYEQQTPFMLAYNAHFGSIEVDIWAVNGDLFVAHNKSNIKAERSLDSLYIQPIVRLFRKNGGKAWSNYPSTFQLMIDLKTAAEPTLPLLVEKLKKYPDVFDSNQNNNAIRVVITGNRPKPSGFSKYPLFIWFDGNVTLKYDDQQLKRIALYSENLAGFTSWKGKEPILEKEAIRLKQVIDSVHGLNKKIRFWNAPDDAFAWKTLMNLKVDYLNTDHIQELSTFLQNK